MQSHAYNLSNHELFGRILNGDKTLTPWDLERALEAVSEISEEIGKIRKAIKSITDERQQAEEEEEDPRNYEEQNEDSYQGWDW